MSQAMKNKTSIWTEDKIRDELPAVRVLAESGTFDGTLSGRLNDFATVTFRVSGIPVSADWAWSTVVNALNNGRPLRY